MNEHKPHTRPRALESPLQALHVVESAAYQRLRDLRGNWPDAMSHRVMSLVRDNHQTNADVILQLSPDDEVVTIDEHPELQDLQDLLQRAHAITKVIRLESKHLEQLERALVRAYEMETAPEIGHLSTHAKRVLRSGNLIRAAQNLRVIRLMPHRRDETVGTQSPGHAQDVHRSSDASFPASDAPSWTGTHV